MHSTFIHNIYNDNESNFYCFMETQAVKKNADISFLFVWEKTYKCTLKKNQSIIIRCNRRTKQKQQHGKMLFLI